MKLLFTKPLANKAPNISLKRRYNSLTHSYTCIKKKHLILITKKKKKQQIDKILLSFVKMNFHRMTLSYTTSFFISMQSILNPNKIRCTVLRIDLCLHNFLDWHLIYIYKFYKNDNMK